MKRIWAVLTAAATVGATVIGGAGAGAAATNYSFVGYAGGTFVRALNNTIESDLTAASSINTTVVPAADHDNVATVHLAQLLNAGAVTTSTATANIPNGYEVVSQARTAAVNALNGLITADAIQTVTVAKVVNGVASSSVQTTLVNLRIGGKAIPITVPKNFHIEIPGIARIYLNWQSGGAQGNKAIEMGVGAYVSLLQPEGSFEAGASLAISAAYAALGPVVPPPSGHFLFAKAYGTSIHANVGTLVGVQSDPTAPVTMAAAGTDGKPQTSSIAAVHLGQLTNVGVVTDTVIGTNTTSGYDAAASSKVASINLFGGAIKADAITAFARVFGPASGSPTTQASSKLVNLVIGGKAIPINAGPNTTIRIANLATVVINQQVRRANSVLVRALDITLSTAAYGLPAGAEIQVAVAQVSVS
jgi:hypothetical protein